jgi:hypothetical protein
MKTEKFDLSEKQLILITKIIDASARNSYAEVGYYLSQIINNEKEFIKILKEEFKRNWDIDFKDSPLKQLTAHDEMCFKNCDCSEIICNWIDKLAGKELVE